MILSVPGDKSISHRAAILAALSDGLCTITGFLESEDCLNTLAALRQLGIKIEHSASGTLVIHGAAGKITPPTTVLKPVFKVAEADEEQGAEGAQELSGLTSVSSDPRLCGDDVPARRSSSPSSVDCENRFLFCGNSGTTMRLLAGLLAAQPFSSQLVGDASLSSRPMKRVIEPLAMMGAGFNADGEKKTPPLFIHGKNLQPICYELPIPSAQVKSAILLASLFTTGETTIIEPIACRDHTERMFEAFQIEHACSVDEQGRRIIKITGPQRPIACDVAIPGDISSAAFWIVAAAANVDSHLEIQNVGLNPTRTGILNVLHRMGAKISITEQRGQGGEFAGTIKICGTQLHGTIIEGAEIPNVIDELPILAVAGALAHGTTTIKNAVELRVKETDRITAIVTNLRALGAEIIEHDDGMEIHGGKPLRGAMVKSYGDHRIAMAMAIAGLFTRGKVTLDDTTCIATSYPGFEQTLALLHNGVTSGE